MGVEITQNDGSRDNGEVSTPLQMNQRERASISMEYENRSASLRLFHLPPMPLGVCLSNFLKRGPWLAQSVQHVTLDPEVVGLNPMLDTEIT